MPDFSYDGRIKIVSDYRNEATSFSNIVWTKEKIEEQIRQFQSGNLNAGKTDREDEIHRDREGDRKKQREKDIDKNTWTKKDIDKKDIEKNR